MPFIFCYSRYVGQWRKSSKTDRNWHFAHKYSLLYSSCDDAAWVNLSLSNLGDLHSGESENDVRNSQISWGLLSLQYSSKLVQVRKAYKRESRCSSSLSCNVESSRYNQCQVIIFCGMYICVAVMLGAEVRRRRYSWISWHLDFRLHSSSYTSYTCNIKLTLIRKRFGHIFSERLSILDSINDMAV